MWSCDQVALQSSAQYGRRLLARVMRNCDYECKRELRARRPEKGPISWFINHQGYIHNWPTIVPHGAVCTAGQGCGLAGAAPHGFAYAYPAHGSPGITSDNVSWERLEPGPAARPVRSASHWPPGGVVTYSAPLNLTRPAGRDKWTSKFSQIP